MSEMILVMRQEDMDKHLKHCECCNQGGKGPEVFLHPTCHPNAGLWISYHAEGYVEVACKACHEVVTRIAVGSWGASEPTSDMSEEGIEMALAEWDDANNTRPPYEHVLEIMKSLPLHDLQQVGDKLKVHFTRPLSQTECFTLFELAPWEPVGVSEEQVIMYLWWGEIEEEDLDDEQQD